MNNSVLFYEFYTKLSCLKEFLFVKTKPVGYNANMVCSKKLLTRINW